MVQDIRLALRLLRRAPVPAAVALLSIGLSVGATAVVFAAVKAVLIDPLPYARPSEIVQLRSEYPAMQERAHEDWVVWNDVRELPRRTRSFQAIGAYGNAIFDLAGDANATPEALYGVRVNAALFPMLGVPPMLGRAFLQEYLNSSYDPDLEYVDGALVGRNVGTFLHSWLQSIVIAYLSRIAETHPITVLTECRLFMANTGRHRIPDITVLERPHGRERVVTDVPAAVIEIKSPNDTLDEIFNKCLEYADFGIPNIVVLDPDYKRQYMFADKALRIALVDRLILPRTQARLPFPAAEFFAKLDE
jgi:Uma2 family endonuclease